MQKWNVYKCLITTLLAILSSQTQAAKIIEIWDRPDNLKVLNSFYFNNTAQQANSDFLFISKNKNPNNAHEFKLFKSVVTNQISHSRYKQYYKGVEIWNTELIVHHKNNTRITGTLVLELEKNIKAIQPTLTVKAGFAKAKMHLASQYPQHQLSIPRLVSTKKVIYIKRPNLLSATATANLAYYYTFFIDDHTTRRTHRPVMLIDANDGSLLTYYDNLQSVAVGTGPGGNDITQTQAPFMPRLANHYQFGDAIPGLPALGFLPVQVDSLSNICTMQTSIIRLSSWNNVNFNAEDFPVTYVNEPSHPVFSYACTSGSHYENTNDGGFAPVINNGFSAYSPTNDSFYFGDLSYQVLRQYLPDIVNPWGRILPIRIYTHVGNYDNAGAYSPPASGEEPLDPLTFANFPPQFIVGNGETLFYPLSDAGTVGHELAHIFTAYASNLIYEQQSGGINEAYSDITGATVEWYLSRQYPWYGFGWAIGPSVSLPSGPFAGKALRYMDNPPLDGHSIDNAANFVPDMDVHYSSGVYNKAFYLMVTSGVDFFKAYQYFSYANTGYWENGANYFTASCGVMQAAIDQGNQADFHKIVQAFKAVGVNCKVGLKQLFYTI